MQAVILAGGLGTRLRPLTLNIPKPIIPIGNQPFLLRQIELLKAAGITDIILALNYQPSAIENVLGDGSAHGVKLKYLIEPAPLGTAGAYKFAAGFLDTTTIVLNGDILTDADLQSVVRHHENLNSRATIVLTEVENPAAYGLVESDENFKVLRFLEKPQSAEIGDSRHNTVNAGIYVFEPKILDLIPANTNYSFEYQLFPALLAAGESFHSFVAKDSYWLDIGTPQRYLQANRDLINGKIKNFQAQRSAEFYAADSAQIDARSLFAEGCRVEEKAKITNSVIGKNVSVGRNSVIRNSVIWADTKIASGAAVYDSVIGNKCVIGENNVVARGSVIADQTNFPPVSRC